MSEEVFERIKTKALAVPGMTEQEALFLATIRSNPRFSERTLRKDGMSREEYAEIRWSGMQKYIAFYGEW